MKLPDKVYNVLKWITLIALPALATFYRVIEEVWHLSIYGEEVAGTLTALAALLGVLIGVSTYNYNKLKSSEEDIDVENRTIGEDNEYHGE